MHFLFAIGRLIIFDFRLFEIEDDFPSTSVLIRSDEEPEDDGGIFGAK